MPRLFIHDFDEDDMRPPKLMRSRELPRKLPPAAKAKFWNEEPDVYNNFMARMVSERLQYPSYAIACSSYAPQSGTIYLKPDRNVLHGRLGWFMGTAFIFEAFPRSEWGDMLTPEQMVWDAKKNELRDSWQKVSDLLCAQCDSYAYYRYSVGGDMQPVVTVF